MLIQNGIRSHGQQARAIERSRFKKSNVGKSGKVVVF